jgi:hypothetical protein
VHVSWRRDALVAFLGDVRDEGIAPPKHSVYNRVILSVKHPGEAVAQAAGAGALKAKAKVMKTFEKNRRRMVLMDLDAGIIYRMSPA